MSEDEQRFDWVEAAQRACVLACSKARSALHADTRAWVQEAERHGAHLQMVVDERGEITVFLMHDGVVLLPLVDIGRNGATVVLSPPARCLRSVAEIFCNQND